MPDHHKQQGLSEILEVMADAGHGECVSLADVSEALGSRSFGPLLLVPCLILISPLSAIPGVPTFGAAVISLVAMHMLLGRDELWLPEFIRKQRLQRSRMRAVVRSMKPIAASIDRHTGRRLVFLTRRPFSLLLLVPCIALALAMPPLEIVPMSSTVLATLIFLLALALTVRDGVLALAALAAVAVAVALALKLLF